MTNGLAQIALGALSMLALISGLAFRAGRLRYLARGRWDERRSVLSRNIAMGLIPAAAVCSAALIALVAYAHADKPSYPIVGTALAISMIASIVGLGWVMWPPPWLLPRWIREEERRRGRPVNAGSMSRVERILYLGLAGLVLIGAILTAVATLVGMLRGG